MKFNLDSEEFNNISTIVPDIALPAPANALARSTQTGTSTEKEVSLKPYLKHLGMHGGIYQLLDPHYVAAMMKRVVAKMPALKAKAAAATPHVTMRAATIFKHLASALPGGNRPYVIHSPLISHLTFPHDGRTYARPGEPNDNEAIPAFITFVGQFLDHDLTLNPMNLFDDQKGTVRNEASAVIDLDSVYKRDSVLRHGAYRDIFHGDGRFKLRKIAGDPNAYDLMREVAPAKPENQDRAYIFDGRNDENQMILQIHILLMRVHNKLVERLTPAQRHALGGQKGVIDSIRTEVQRNWQSFVLNEYLPTVVSAEPLGWVLGEIGKPHHGALKHKPNHAKVVKMPHEFAISFRMGHTQLRDAYRVRPQSPPVKLFDNQNAQPNDLRGSTPLVLDHVIDWPFFSAKTVYSNKIDTQVTSVVFDLPQSAIPDAVKQVGNLPQRNLIRSSQVELAAAEDLAELYGLTPLTPERIERDPEKRKLFQLDENGRYDATNPFRTPLWYYVIKEAEFLNYGGQLGPLGGRIIAEVIAGGIHYLPTSFVHDDAWQSAITGTREVAFKDLVDFVTV